MSTTVAITAIQIISWLFVCYLFYRAGESGGQAKVYREWYAWLDEYQKRFVK